MRVFRAAAILFLIVLLTAGPAHRAEASPLSVVVHGEYPVVEELREGRFGPRDQELTGDQGSPGGRGGPGEADAGAGGPPLIDYRAAEDLAGRAMAEALHLMSANVYGYRFTYRPGSVLMETEELFEVELRGAVEREQVRVLASGVRDQVYRVKIELPLTPSASRWMGAFATGTVRRVSAEGISDFFQGWEGRSDALRLALRNLVLTAARKQLRSKPLLITGDILLKGTPAFAVGAGRHYCRVEGYVNLVDVVTYD
ncbi:MAG: hypothetical protein ACOC8N_09310 [Spirochaetota bacterium]